MNNTLKIRKNLNIFGIPVLIFGIMVLISKSSAFKLHPDKLSLAITADLLLIVPLAYFLLIRKTTIPKTTVVPVLVIGMIIGTILLPTRNQYYLGIFKTWVFPVIELFIVSYLIYKIRKAVKSYKLHKSSSADFFTTLKTTCYEKLPKAVVIPFVTEIAVFYYGFIHWKKRDLKKNEFSYHKDSGTIALLFVTIFIIAIETVVVHKLLLKWNSIVAWVLTILSVYSSIQLFGFLKSMYKRPISIKNGKLFLRYGIMNETTIDLTKIDSIEISSKDIEIDNETRKLSFLGELESHNIVIHLKEENTLIGLYGIKRTYKNLALHVDNKNDFVNVLNSAIENPEH